MGDGPDTTSTTRVMLVDDHEVVRAGLRTLLTAQDDMEVVAEASTAAEAVLRARSYHPDVVVLDVRLPDRSGVEVCRDIRSEHPEMAVLMLTSFSDDQALFDSIMAGASGYILKQVRGNDLVETVRRVAAGESMLDPSVTARVLERVRNGPPRDAQLEALTMQEQKILELIGEGLTNRQIGERMFLAEKTVKNYVSHILAKLGLQRRTQAAVLVTERRTARP